MKLRNSIIAALGATIGYYGWKKYVIPRLPIISGYAAKYLSSQIFVTGLPIEKVMKEDLGFFPMQLAEIDVDIENKSISSTVFGQARRTAVYREGLGCMLNHVAETSALPASESLEKMLKSRYNNPLTDTHNGFHHTAIQKPLTDSLRQAIDMAFNEINPLSPLHTRAVVVMHKGEIIGEQYADGVKPETRLLGWSMTKSVFSALAGVLHKQGKFKLDDPVPVKAWKGTVKGSITWRNLLQMNSGLDWVEDYKAVRTVNEMLFSNQSTARYAIRRPLKYMPNSHWCYSSGDTNILAYLMKDFFDNQEDYWKFPYHSFFDKIGMPSMFMETDMSGHFVGSSYSYATPREWANFGQLYLNNGEWEGEQVLDKEWIDFTKETAPNSEGQYGAQFWLNRSGDFPDVPEDMYFADGFQGQRIFIIPSKDLVVVRMGVMYKKDGFDFNQWLKEVIQAIP